MLGLRLVMTQCNARDKAELREGRPVMQLTGSAKGHAAKRCTRECETSDTKARQRYLRRVCPHTDSAVAMPVIRPEGVTVQAAGTRCPGQCRFTRSGPSESARTGLSYSQKSKQMDHAVESYHTERKSKLRAR